MLELLMLLCKYLFNIWNLILLIVCVIIFGISAKKQYSKSNKSSKKAPYVTKNYYSIAFIIIFVFFIFLVILSCNGIKLP